MKQVKLLAVIVFFIVLVFSTNCYAEDYDKIKEGDILTDGSVIGIYGGKDLIISTGGEKEFKVDGKTNNTYIMKDVDMIDIEAHSTRWKVLSVTENENSIKLIIEPQYDIEVKDLKEGMDIKKGTIIKFPKAEGKAYKIEYVGVGSGFENNGNVDMGIEIGYNTFEDREKGYENWPEEIETWRIRFVESLDNGNIFMGILPAYDICFKDLYEGLLIKPGARFVYDNTEWDEEFVGDNLRSCVFSIGDYTSDSIGGWGLLLMTQNDISKGNLKNDANFLRVKSIEKGAGEDLVILEPVYEEETIDNNEESPIENISNEKDETPKTGTFDMVLYVLGAIALVSVVAAVKSKTGKYSK